MNSFALLFPVYDAGALPQAAPYSAQEREVVQSIEQAPAAAGASPSAPVPAPLFAFDAVALWVALVLAHLFARRNAGSKPGRLMLGCFAYYGLYCLIWYFMPTVYAMGWSLGSEFFTVAGVEGLSYPEMPYGIDILSYLAFLTGVCLLAARLALLVLDPSHPQSVRASERLTRLCPRFFCRTEEPQRSPFADDSFGAWRNPNPFVPVEHEYEHEARNDEPALAPHGQDCPALPVAAAWSSSEVAAHDCTPAASRYDKSWRAGVGRVADRRERLALNHGHDDPIRVSHNGGLR